MSAETDAVELVERAGGVELSVKVVPGASRTKVVGVWGVALRIAVAAPPEAGKANAAVIKLLADLFGVKRSDVEIVGGQTQPLKRVRLPGTNGAEVRAAIRAILE